LACNVQTLPSEGLRLRGAARHSWEDLVRMTRIAAPVCAGLLSFTLGACANTAQGVKVDAEKATETVAAGAETVDVKAALIADGRVDASNVNVDTMADTKTVVLKGTVPTEEQRKVAEQIAREQAKGYRITNSLTVAPKAQP
jgi:hyperosmotically inducible protein